MTDLERLNLQEAKWQAMVRSLPNGVAEIEIKSPAEGLFPLVKTLASGRGYCLALVNLKQAKLNSLEGVALGDSVIGNDVLEQLPSELLANDSLHLVQWPAINTEVVQDSFRTLLASDALTVVFTDWDRPAFIEHQKLLWGWMLKPSSIRFHVENSPKQLADKLVGSKVELLTLDLRGKRFLLYAAAATVPVVLRRLEAPVLGSEQDDQTGDRSALAQ